MPAKTALICSPIVLSGRLIPWSVPTIGAGRYYTDRRGRVRRAARKNPALKAFQNDVKLRAQVAMAGSTPYGGPVELILSLYKAECDGHPSGSWWDSTPDLTNLLKGIEDGLKAVVFDDDRQVCRVSVTKQYAGIDGCRVVVAALPTEEGGES